MSRYLTNYSHLIVLTNPKSAAFHATLVILSYHSILENGLYYRDVKCKGIQMEASSQHNMEMDVEKWRISYSTV